MTGIPDPVRRRTPPQLVLCAAGAERRQAWCESYLGRINPHNIMGLRTREARPRRYHVGIRGVPRDTGNRMKALITGSGGLIGSECARLLIEEGWQVVGVDNDMRRQFFGEAGTTRPVVEHLLTLRGYRPFHLDIRDRQGIRDLIEGERPDFVIHTAAQPSHDKAASIPYEDFDVNAGGTMNVLVACRDFCPDSPLCFTSTNKVYGDRPNSLPLIETEKRYDYANGLDGIDESMSIDNCLHSVFGASKLAADVMSQEFGRYFQMPVGIFRGGCLTGPQHAAVELHGYLAYIIHSAITGREYVFADIRASRFATRSTPATWPACSWSFTAIPAAGRCITWAAAGRTAYPFWRPSICSRAWVTPSNIATNPKIASATISAISRTCERSGLTFLNGAWNTTFRGSSTRLPSGNYSYPKRDLRRTPASDSRAKR